MKTSKRRKPYSDRAATLAVFIGQEMQRNQEADRFAVIAHRKTWAIIRMALRKYAE